MGQPKIALVHDYLTQPGGAERVFELLCQRYPEADIYTSIYDPKATIDLGDRLVRTTWLQQIPGAAKHFRMLAPLYFPAFRSLDLSDYDVILSSTTSFAKSVKKRPGAKHICFCHNVTRFLWDTETYLRQYTGYGSLYPVLKQIFVWMQQADLHYAQEPDLYIANSSTVARRIREFYQREAWVINYPIDDRKFSFCDRKDNFFLASARLLSYKRVDVIVEAFNALGWTLLITGDGPERERLEQMAHPNVQFLGHVSDEHRCQLMSKAKAVVVAALEDYGLVPVEANVSGTPVVAYGAGGVLDTQIDGETGLLFPQQTAESLKLTLRQFDTMEWDHLRIHRWAMEQFSQASFFRKLDRCLAEHFLPHGLGPGLSLDLSQGAIATPFVEAS